MVKSMVLAHGTVVTSGLAQATELLKLYTSVVPSDQLNVRRAYFIQDTVDLVIH